MNVRFTEVNTIGLNKDDSLMLGSQSRSGETMLTATRQALGLVLQTGSYCVLEAHDPRRQSCF